MPGTHAQNEIFVAFEEHVFVVSKVVVVPDEDAFEAVDFGVAVDDEDEPHPATTALTASNAAVVGTIERRRVSRLRDNQRSAPFRLNGPPESEPA
jgi:hypothetical protein